MSITRKAVPLILASGLLTGCAGIQKTDWPTCAAVGGVTGAALGAIESSEWAGGGALVGAGMAAAYCWVHGAEEQVAVVEETVVEEVVAEPAEPVRVELDVKFDFDKTAVKPESQADIKALADFMSQYPATTTVVEGHTDSVGTDAYNQGLSERRAKAVYDYLTSNGIDSSRLAGPVGYGLTRPIDTNETKEGRARNRRTELNVQN